MHYSHNEIVMITALIAQMINLRQVEKTEELVMVKGCWLTQIHLTQTLSILTLKFLNAESTASQSGYEQFLLPDYYIVLFADQNMQ